MIYGFLYTYGHVERRTLRQSAAVRRSKRHRRPAVLSDISAEDNSAGSQLTSPIQGWSLIPGLEELAYYSTLGVVVHVDLIS